MSTKKRIEPGTSPPTMEYIFREWFQIREPSALQRAICLASDGLPLGDLASDEIVVRAFGGAEAVAQLGAVGRPTHVLLVAGVRAGKSVLAAAAMLRSALVAELVHLAPGDVPRVSVVSRTLDLAKSVYRHLVGASQATPELGRRIAAVDGEGLVLLRADAARGIEVCTAAMAAAGSSIVARWCAGLCLDEAPRLGGVEAAASYDDMVTAVAGRLLPGAQIWSVGSPWRAQGPAHEAWSRGFGRPSPDLVVIHAPAYALCPQLWPAARCASVLRTNPLAHRTDVEAEWLTEADDQWIPTTSVDACVRATPLELPPERPALPAVAAMDPATRGDAWTVVVLVVPSDGRPRVAAARQWRAASEPLEPAAVLEEVASLCRRYAVPVCYTDQWSGDALRALARHAGLDLISDAVQGTRRTAMYDDLRSRVASGGIELAPVPDLLSDLRRVRRRLSTTGVVVELPSTPDGRHCDFAPALALALAHLPQPAVAQAPELAALHEEYERHLRMADARRDPLDRLPDLEALERRRWASGLRRVS